MDQILDNNNKKTPIFVKIYEKLYDMISDGITFPVNSKLPPESKLAEMLGVSRITLRQALALLTEDGLIEKIQGKGNFVKSAKKAASIGLENFQNPIFNCSDVVINEIEMDFRIEFPNEYEQKVFVRRTSVMVAVDRWYRSHGTLVAYTLSLIPIETISKLEIDLNFSDQLKDALEKKIYEIGTRSKLVIKPTDVGKFISEKYILSEDENVVLIYEYIYNDDDYAPLICNKHYFVPQFFSFEVNVKSK